MLAAKAGHLNVVKKLITNGASLDITNKVNSLSTTGIQCTQLHAQHVTMLCRLSANCCLCYCQLTVPHIRPACIYWALHGKHLLIVTETSTCYIHLKIDFTQLQHIMRKIHETFFCLSIVNSVEHLYLTCCMESVSYNISIMDVTKGSTHGINAAMPTKLNTKFKLTVLYLLAWYDSCRHGFHQWAARCVPGACGGKLHLFYNYAGTGYVLLNCCVGNIPSF